MRVLRCFCSVFITVLILTFIPLPGHAGENLEVLPKEMQGTWALVSCEADLGTMINTKYYNININNTASDQDTFFRLVAPFSLITKQDDFYFIQIGSTVSAFRLTKEGLLLQNIDPDYLMIGDAPAQNWVQFNPDNNLTYKKCKGLIEKNTDSLLKEISDIAPALDILRDYCPLTGRVQNLSCHKIFFNTIDQDKNGTINHDESVRLYRILNHLSQAITQGSLTVEDYEIWEKSGEEFAENILAVFDDNRSGSFGLDDIKEYWNSFAASQDGRDFIETLDTVQTALAKDSPIYDKENSACGSPESVINNAAIPADTAAAQNSSCMMSDDPDFLQ